MAETCNEKPNHIVSYLFITVPKYVIIFLELYTLQQWSKKLRHETFSVFNVSSKSRGVSNVLFNFEITIAAVAFFILHENVFTDFSNISYVSKQNQLEYGSSCIYISIGSGARAICRFCQYQIQQAQQTIIHEITIFYKVGLLLKNDLFHNKHFQNGPCI